MHQDHSHPMIIVLWSPCASHHLKHISNRKIHVSPCLAIIVLSSLDNHQVCWEVNAPGKSAGSYQYLLRPNKKTELKIRSTLVKEVFYQNMKFNRDSSDLVSCQLLSSLFLPSVFVISNFLYVHFSSAFQRHSCDWRETCVLSCNWHYVPELGIGSALGENFASLWAWFASFPLRIRFLAVAREHRKAPDSFALRYIIHVYTDWLNIRIYK